MKIVKLLFISTIICSSLSFASLTPNPNEELTGDIKLSCEAILCLSTSTRPSECSPALKRYFSISHKHWKDTIKSRRDFLNLCPIHKERAEDIKLENLLNLLVENPDACEINNLNRKYPACGKKLGSNSGSNSEITECKKISLPQGNVCEALYNHEYTDIKKPQWKCTKTMSRREIAKKNQTSLEARLPFVSTTLKTKYEKNNPNEEVCVEASWVLED